MAKPWAQVEESEQYQALPDTEKEAVRTQYFNAVVAPHVATRDLDGVRNQFMRDSAPSFGKKVGRAASAAASGIKEFATDTYFKGANDNVMEGADGARGSATPSQQSVARSILGEPEPVPTPELREAYGFGEASRDVMAERRSRAREQEVQNLMDRNGADRGTAEMYQAVADREGMDGAKRAGFMNNRGQASESTFDFDTQREYKEASTGARGLAKGGQLMKQQGAGLMLFMAEHMPGQYPNIERAMREAHSEAAGTVEAIGERANGFERNLEWAIASTLSQAPALGVGVATGGTAVPLLAMGSQVFGDEYAAGRRAGLNKGSATTRAAAMGAAEIVGERLGLGQMIGGLRAAGAGKAPKEVIKFFAQSIAREIPGEQITTALQFGADKYLPQGLNPEATLEQYLTQVADTLAQTVMQTGMMAGGGMGINAGIRKLQGAGRERTDDTDGTVDAGGPGAGGGVAAGSDGAPPVRGDDGSGAGISGTPVAGSGSPGTVGDGGAADAALSDDGTGLADASSSGEPQAPSIPSMPQPAQGDQPNTTSAIEQTPVPMHLPPEARARVGEIDARMQEIAGELPTRSGPVQASLQREAARLGAERETVTTNPQPDEGDANAERPEQPVEAPAAAPEAVTPARKPAQAQRGPVIDTERMAAYGDDLEAMSQDAGWAEVGGRLVVDATGKKSRSQWLPHAEWFRAGMEGDVDTLRRHVQAARNGQWVPAKSRRTIEGMMEWIEAQRNNTPVTEDSSAFDLERIGYNELDQNEQAALDALDDVFAAEASTGSDEAAGMLAMGFTEEEINELTNPQGTDRSGQGEDGPAESGAAGQGSRENGEPFALASQSEQELRDQADRVKAEQDAKDKADQEAEQRAQADAERDTFTLTGSDRTADVQAAQGQGGLFEAPPSAPVNQEPVKQEARAPAGETPKATSSEQAKTAAKPAAKTKKAKRPDAGERLGMKVGDTVTFSQDIDYLSGGVPYVVESVGKEDVYFRNPKNGGGSSVRANFIETWKKAGRLSWEVQSPKQDAIEQANDAGENTSVPPSGSAEDSNLVERAKREGELFSSNRALQWINDRAGMRRDEHVESGGNRSEIMEFAWSGSIPPGMRDKMRSLPWRDGGSKSTVNLMVGFTPNPENPEFPLRQETVTLVRGTTRSTSSDITFVRMIEQALPAKTGGQAGQENPAPKIEDFGEKIGGARKDVWSSFKETMAEAMGRDVAVEPLSKSWPAPNYEKLIEEGVDDWTVAFVRSARDAIPAKPRKGWKLKSWAEITNALRDASAAILNGSMNKNDVRLRVSKLAETNHVARDVLDRVRLYQAVGHSVSLADVTLSAGAYTLRDGVEYNPAKTFWTVAKKAKATAFSNWPRELAIGETKEEAVANFKEKFDSMDLSAPTKRGVSFGIFSTRGEKGYWIGKKVGRNPIRLTENFESLVLARNHMKQHHDDLVAELEKRKAVPSERRSTNEPRVGEDMRNGQDVTPELFSETFGFRGVEFGNWVEGARRQRDLNDAFDALMDMAAVLDVPAKALSLNGQLGLAFGARGSGGVNPAAAHYERNKVVINLTKKAGAGSLGHEWWHALDNYFSRMRKRGDGMMTDSRDVSLAARGSQYEHQGEVRREMIDAYGEVVKAIRSTAMKARSSKLDAKRSKDYWTTEPEMSARAYESYLISKLQDQGAANDYLANVVDPATWKAAESLGFELDDSYPYPTAGEIPAIRAAFDRFFETIDTRETEGGTAFFSRRDDGRTGTDRPRQAGQAPGRSVAGEPRSGWVEETRLRTRDGRPVTFYRGAGKPLTGEDFEVAARGVASGKPASGMGVFFSSSEEEAGRHGAVEPFHLDVRNPKIIKAGDNPAFDSVEDAARWTQGLADEGFDALVIDARSLGGNVHVVPFSAEQVIYPGYEQDAAMSRVAPAGRVIHMEDLDAVASRFRAAFPRIPVVTLETEAKAPKPLRDDIRRMGADGEVAGAYMDGKIYLVRANIADVDHAEFTVLHEATHAGLSGILGPAINDHLLGLYRANESLRAEADKIAWKHRYSKVRATEEALADMGGEAARLTGWAKFAAFVRSRLRKLGFVREWSDNDIIYLVQQALKYNRKPAGTSVFGRTAYSRVGGEQTINVDGTERPTTNSKGQRIAQTEEGLRNFWRWFGDSMVVDADGKPLVVYHGTGSDVAQFEKMILGSNTGAPSASSAFFFTTSSEVATGYAALARTPEETQASIMQAAASSPVLSDGMRSALLDQADKLKSSDGFIQNSQTFSATGFVGGANVMPVYLKMVAPLEHDYQGQEYRDRPFSRLLKEAQSVSRDGVIFRSAEDSMHKDFAELSDIFAVFDPSQIKSAAGNRGTFDPGNPDIRYSRQRNLTHAPAGSALESARKKMSLGPRPSMGARVRTAFASVVDALKTQRKEYAQAFRQGAFDQFYGIKRAEERTLGNLPAEQSAYVAARLATGSASVLRAVLLHGQPQWAKNGQHLEKKPDTQGLLEILQPVAEELDDWIGWMVGNRAARLMREGRENLFEQDEINALRDLAKGREEKFKKAADDFAAFKRSILDVAEKAGLIDKETRPAWDHADWIPFYRQREEAGDTLGPRGRRGMAGQSSGIRMLKGGDSALSDPMQNIIMNFQHLLDASLKNNAVRKAIAYAKDVVEPVGMDFKAELVPAAEIRRVMHEQGVPDAIIKSIPGDAFAGIRKMWSMQAPSDPDVIRVMVDGKAQYFRVRDPLLLRAVTSFQPFDFPGLGMARLFRRVLTASVTATPEFMLRNFIRDTASTAIISRDMTAAAGAFKGIVKAYRETGGAEHMMFAGASFQGGYIDGHDRERTARQIRRALRKKGLSAASADAFVGSMIDSTASLWEHYQKIGESIENANREAVFEATKKATGSTTASAYEAKDLMDFSLRGSWAGYQLLADVLPFFNARVQGLYRLGRTNPKALAIRGALLLTVPSIMLALANAGDEEYEQLPDWDKDTYWHVFVGGEHFRIPKPFEVGVFFATMPERVIGAIAGEDDGRKFLARAWWNIHEQLNLVDWPQIAKPVIEAWANRDTFTGRDIETMGDERHLPHARYNERTSATMRELVGAIAPVSDAVGLSPKKAQHIFEGYLGTMGAWGLAAMDQVTRLAADDPVRPAWRVDDFPVLRVFYRGDENLPAYSTQHIQDVYDGAREYEKVVATAKAKFAEGREGEGREMLAEPDLKWQAPLAGAAKALSAINKQIERVTLDRNLTPEQKRVKIDELLGRRNDRARDAVQTSRSIKASVE